MTTRRTLLQGAASLIAPTQFQFAKPCDFLPGASPFNGFIQDYRQILEQLDGLYEARNLIEKDAIARKIDWTNCPKLEAVSRKERGCYDAGHKLIQLASRMTAVSIDDIMLKLILWRLTDVEAECFANLCDMLPFAAYCDLLTLTGQASLTQKADEKALEIIWDDRAFDLD